MFSPLWALLAGVAGNVHVREEILLGFCLSVGSRLTVEVAGNIFLVIELGVVWRRLCV